MNKYKTATKVFASVIAAAVGLWQVPAVQAALLPVLGHHPAVSGAITAAVGYWLLLHEPQTAQPKQNP